MHRGGAWPGRDARSAPRIAVEGGADALGGAYVSNASFWERCQQLTS
jgi:hypothetical protein